eukprot:6202910-Pleurochrysis_carterae.AAC.2
MAACCHSHGSAAFSLVFIAKAQPGLSDARRAASGCAVSTAAVRKAQLLLASTCRGHAVRIAAAPAAPMCCTELRVTGTRCSIAARRLAPPAPSMIRAERIAIQRKTRRSALCTARERASSAPAMGLAKWGASGTSSLPTSRKLATPPHHIGVD